MAIVLDSYLHRIELLNRCMCLGLSRSMSFLARIAIVLYICHCQCLVWSYRPTHYVKLNKSSPCPDFSWIVQCQTLDWYSIYWNESFTSDTEMLFQEGTHQLSRFIRASDCHNFSLAGNGTALYNGSGHPRPTSTIKCTPAAASGSSGLLFANSSNLSIRNLHFTFCGGLYNLHNTRKYASYAGSLVFNSVQDLTLYQVVVSGGRGYGVHANNVFGNIEVHESAFLNATPHLNVSDSGNAIFYFEENFSAISTTVVVNSSQFMHGKTGGSYSAAGGLNVFIYCPNVRVIITDVVAEGNTGINGGNLALFVMTHATSDSSIYVNASRVADGRARKGGGVRFWSKHKLIEGGFSRHGAHQVLLIENTVFHGNRVRQTGGALYMAFYNNNTVASFDGILRLVTIANCTFTDNTGNGAGMEIIQHSLSEYVVTPMFKTTVKQSTFIGNSIPPNIDGPILDIIDVELSLANCTFVGSNGSVISLRDSHLSLYNDTLFENNTAAQVGAALKVCGSSIVFTHIDTHVQFVNNSAQKGGAIYVQKSCTDISPLCFLQPSVSRDMPIVEFTKHMAFEFVNNTATLAGDILYGGDVDICSTMVPYFWNASQEHNHYWYSKEVIFEIFKIQQQGTSMISSDARKVCFCATEQKLNNFSCAEEKPKVDIFPGEEFTVSVLTVGQVDGPTPGMVITDLVGDNQQSHYLVRMNHPKPTAKHCIDLRLTLHTNRTNAAIHFKPATADVGAHYGIVVSNLTVSISRCPLGFQLTPTPPYKCICSPLLVTYVYLPAIANTMCNISKQTIVLPQKRLWFGCYDSATTNHSSDCSALVVTPNCQFYCRRANDSEARRQLVEVMVTDVDSQCSEGHTGIMCGGCKSGYSRVLGGSLECRKDCTNFNAPFIVLGSIASSILIIVLIIVLNLTVSEGTLNGLLVYSMVIQSPRSYFPEMRSTYGKACWAFISWINFAYGFDTCFFRGMNGYQVVVVFFAQVFYTVFVLVLIILLSRRFIFFTRILGRNSVKVLASMVCLLYSNFMYAIIITFQYAVLHVSPSNGTTYKKLVWYYDGNVPYLGLKHAPLFVLSLICSVVMAFFVFSLLLIQCLQKRSDQWCLRWVERLRPFYEAYTGPCRDNYRFWPGFLFLVRSAIYVMNSLMPQWSLVLFQAKMLITASVMVFVMSMSCVFPRGVYKRWPLNILEFSFYLNLCITSGLLVNSKKSASIIVYTSVTISAVTFVGILMYHAYGQISRTSIWKKLTAWCLGRYKTLFKRKQSRRLEAEETSESSTLLPNTPIPTVLSISLDQPIIEA